MSAQEFIQYCGIRFLPFRSKLHAILAQRLTLARPFVDQYGVAAVKRRLADHGILLFEDRVVASDSHDQWLFLRSCRAGQIQRAQAPVLVWCREALIANT